MKPMRSRDAWLAAIAATLGISEEACRREAAPQIQQVASAAAASSSAPVIAATAPSASADTTATATASVIASAAPSASVPSIAKVSPSDQAKLLEISQAICGAVPRQNVLLQNGACGAIGTQPNSPTTSPRAEITLFVSGGAAGDDHVATNLRPRFRACANQALMQDPSQQGKLVIIVKIAANGEVTSADVASNAGLSPASAQCMTRMVKNAQFPAGAARTLDVAINQTKQSP